jgi:ferrochelatase
MSSASPSKSVGVLLVNLGSPDSPSVPHVRKYLTQFLNDPFVINMPNPFRWLFVRLILTRRPKKSAEAYEKVWTEKGSPLVFHTHDLTAKLAKASPFPVEFGMRYGNPSLESGLKKLLAQNVDHVVMLPMYPQYSYAASETAITLFEKLMKKLAPKKTFHVIESFHQHPAYVKALSESLGEVYFRENPDLLLFSYHGIPERQVNITRNKSNYRNQCFETSEGVRATLNLPENKIRNTFQSRLGPVEWIKPYTDFVLKDLPAEGIKNIVVASPSFTADCLETLEEIALRYSELFKLAGGTKFTYAPCLNSSDRFVSAVQEILKPHTDQ